MRHTLPLVLISLISCGGTNAGTATATSNATPTSNTTATSNATASPTANATSAFAAANCVSIPDGAHVRSIAGSSASDVWAVGLGAAILHFNGTDWSARCELGTETLLAVAASGPSDAWAVGEGRTILHWNGANWSRVEAAFAGTAPFAAVWDGAPTDVWILSREEALHYDGHSWSRTTAAEMTTLGFDFGPFHDLYGTGPADVWIAAESGVLHWDGRGWWASLAAPALQGNLFQSVWAGGPTDAWVAGRNVVGGGVIEHFDGRWAAGNVHIPALESVRGASTGELFLQTDSSLLFSSGGTVADLQPPTPPTGAPFVISASDLFLPDELGIARWDGKAWTRALRVSP